MEIFPNVKTCQLSAPATGALIEWRGQLAIALKAQPRDSHRKLAICSSGGFQYREIAADGDAIAFENELVLEILNPQLLAQNAFPSEESGTRLFVFDDGLRAVIVDDNAQWHWLTLEKGELAKRDQTTSKIPSFTQWRLGFKNSNGKPVWMIEVT